MMRSIERLAAVATFSVLGAGAMAEPAAIEGISCSVPEYHCPASGCSAEMIGQRGNQTDFGTGRNYFLDIPCNLQKGEDVLFVLNLHGGGSIGNWQRHYFPAFDLKDPYRLIVATPSGVVRAWVPENDDEHLKNIVNYVYQKFADVNIRGFWLAGHSQGGQTSNRLATDPFFSAKLTGWVSLSGGRLGSERSTIRAAIPRSAPPPPAMGAGTPGPMRLVAYAEVLPDNPFSHIYVTGQHEIPVDAKMKLPAKSPWAEKLGCGKRVRQADVVDGRAGYVYDSRPQENRNPIWGRDPRPGTAEVYTYPGCRDGRVVADIVRLDKGHTEGLEPHITEEIVRLMWAATPH